MVMIMVKMMGRRRCDLFGTVFIDFRYCISVICHLREASACLVSYWIVMQQQHHETKVLDMLMSPTDNPNSNPAMTSLTRST